MSVRAGEITPPTATHMVGLEHATPLKNAWSTVGTPATRDHALPSHFSMNSPLLASPTAKHSVLWAHVTLRNAEVVAPGGCGAVINLQPVPFHCSMSG
jgi:hypothetical protein